jgi:hypothetical protein
LSEKEKITYEKIIEDKVKESATKDSNLLKIRAFLRKLFEDTVSGDNTEYTEFSKNYGKKFV